MEDEGSENERSENEGSENERGTNEGDEAEAGMRRFFFSLSLSGLGFAIDTDTPGGVLYSFWMNETWIFPI